MELATIRRTYGEIIAGARSEEEFLVLLEESYPRDVVLNLERIQKYARHKWDKPRDAFTTDYTGFVVPECLEQWYDENVIARGADGEVVGRTRGSPGREYNPCLLFYRANRPARRSGVCAVREAKKSVPWRGYANWKNCLGSILGKT